MMDMGTKTRIVAKNVPVRKRATEQKTPSVSISTLYKAAPPETKNAIKAMVIVLNDFIGALRWSAMDINEQVNQGKAITDPADAQFLLAAEAKLNDIRDKLVAIDVLSAFIGPDAARVDVNKSISDSDGIFVSSDMKRVVENAPLTKEMMVNVIAKMRDLEFSEAFTAELQSALNMVAKVEVIVREAIDKFTEKTGVPIQINKRESDEKNIIESAGVKPEPVDDGGTEEDTGLVDDDGMEANAEPAGDDEDLGPGFDEVEIRKLFPLKRYIEQQLPGVYALIRKGGQFIEIGKAQSTTLQTLILSKDKFPTITAAKKWVKDHGFMVTHKGKAPDETEDSFRFRQVDPEDFQPGSFRTIEITDGVKAVIGKLKNPSVAKSDNGIDDDVENESTEVAKSLFAPICKVDDEKRLVTGIVLEPETVDGQGDIYDATVVEKAAHTFMAKLAKGKIKPGIQHKDFEKKIEFVESFVTKDVMSMAGRMLKKGTWLVTAKVHDENVWKAVKEGKLTGFSIGGKAKVQALNQGANNG